MTPIIPLTLSYGDSEPALSFRIIGQKLDLNEINNFAG